MLGILIILWGHAVRVVAGVVLFKLEIEFSSLGLGGLPHFLLTCVVSIDFIEHKNFLLNVNMYAQYSLVQDVVRNLVG